jgi:uncharacterized membrane protein
MRALGLVFLIGVLTGLRSLTPPAATAWAAHLGWLQLPRLLSWFSTTPGVVVFTVLALVELITDKLPNTPSRTATLGLSARIAMSAFIGASVARAGGQGAIVGVALGTVGALVGTFAGYQARMRLARGLRTPDFVVALFEDAVTIAGSLFVVSRF